MILFLFHKKCSDFGTTPCNGAHKKIDKRNHKINMVAVNVKMYVGTLAPKKRRKPFSYENYVLFRIFHIVEFAVLVIQVLQSSVFEPFQEYLYIL